MLKVKRHHFMMFNMKHKTRQVNNTQLFQTDKEYKSNTYILSVKKPDTLKLLCQLSALFRLKIIPIFSKHKNINYLVSLLPHS